MFTALWLIADMAFDMLQIIDYGGEECHQKRGEKDCNWYFYACLLAIVGPVVVLTAIGYLIFFRAQREQERFGVLFFFTFVPPALLYALSPLFHIVKALCKLCGYRPEEEGSMRTFWKLAGILKLAEQILEVIHISH